MASITGFFHGGITVAEMERSLRFYRDGLGLEVEWDRVLDAPYLQEILDMTFESIRVVYLRLPGGGFVELLEHRGIERLPAASRPCDYGAGHICLFVDDLAALAERLFGLGYKARSAGVVDITAGPNAGARAIYVLDPDGYAIELLQPRPGA